MKNYNIKVIDNKTKKVIITFNEISNTKKYLQKKYDAKYKFSYPETKIIVERLIREPGKQIDLFDLINEMEVNNG